MRKNVYEERQNQLRWQSKLGDDQISTDKRARILAKRNDAWNEYRVSLKILYRGPYMNDRVLLNLLSKLWKRD